MDGQSAAEALTPEQMERLVSATLNDRRWSWRVSCWLGDLAVKLEPDVENRWWPQTWAAWLPATLAMVFDGYWIRRYVWHSWRAAAPVPTSDTTPRESDALALRLAQAARREQVKQAHERGEKLRNRGR